MARKNNSLELEFKNDTQNGYDGISYLDFVLDPSAKYVVQVKLEYSDKHN